MNIDALSINDVIEIIKSCDDEHIQILPRDKNEDFMFANNITQTDAKEFIRNLTDKDLTDGPVIDKNPNREHPLWIFKKNGFNKLCYIKVKIINKGRVTIVVSFHEDESMKK